MLQSLSGSEPQTDRISFHFPISDLSQVGEARRFSSELAHRYGFTETQAGRVGIVINELGNNLAKYAADGALFLRVRKEVSFASIEIISLDRGPGIYDVTKSMTDGYTTGHTPGTGLGAVRRLSNLFDIFSMSGKGTSIVSIIHGDANLEVRKYDECLGAICIPYPGETVCGDSWTSGIENDGTMSLLVVDGLGHGEHARKAATEACHVFETVNREIPDRVMSSIHTRLRSTRGAAVMLIKLNPKLNDVTFCGVGNVRSVIIKDMAMKTLISQNGTAGLQIRTLRTMTEAWSHDSVSITHTDGINSRWDIADYPGLQSRHPALIAATVYRDGRRGNDDATVVVVRRAHA